MAEMEYGKIEGIEKPLSRLAQGTMVLSSEKMDWSLELMDQIYEQGCNTFDCAYIYSGGKSDLAFGEWLHTRGVRDKVVVIEKGCHHDQSGSRVNPEALKNDLETSLDRLKTDHVEIYLLHRDDPSVPVDEIVDALNEHVRKGQIKIFGGSNWRPERLEAANAYALTKGLQPFRVSSPNFSLAEMVQSPWGGDCVSISGPQNKKDREWYSRQRM
ncbi:MAG: aldo/keto reductase, partial [Candidatus Sumerlaeota bacterium]